MAGNPNGTDRDPTYKCSRCGATSTNKARCPKKECNGSMREMRDRQK